MEEQAFEGLKVMDFSRIIASPLVTEYLAQLGAIVVRGESSESPDTLRISAPYKDNKVSVNRSGYFAAYNANKYSINLNLKYPQTKEMVRRLVDWCDVVVENFTPDTTRKLGLSYVELSRIKPDDLHKKGL